ncbi:MULTISPECIES: hypothetical protein [unclassified Mesorhizobium]|uniref:hypothetical protein n=1 Tax=unclassified Mesorhizobium TaxID=325217 RepID=UPI002416BB2A|nr:MULTISPECIES: hypothetical protein [unclassified Mesorhizobium]MDG4902790.1 hypothetical protein [Mesorhizobium sp. WSM4962]MDG4920799.1 hypothetical protein [Mesorhizobium sp. WSM4989]
MAVKLGVLFLIACLGLGNAALAYGAEGLNETRDPNRGGGGGHKRLKPDENPNCNKAELKQCRDERRKELDNCPGNFVVKCKDLANVNYSDCKAEAGC